MLGFTALVSLFAALVFGLLPGLRATHVNFHERLVGEGRMVGMRHDRSRLRSSLVVLQVGLSLVLLIGAG